LKKLEKSKSGLEEAAKGKAAHPGDKSVKDSVTIGHLGELVPDKATKGKAAQPSNKGDKVSVTIIDLGELVQKDAKWKKLSFDDFLGTIFLGGEYYWEEFHNKVVNLTDKRKNNHIEFKK
nr:hypothetical protein [Tanacetum cinerariifolium]